MTGFSVVFRIGARARPVTPDEVAEAFCFLPDFFQITGRAISILITGGKHE